MFITAYACLFEGITGRLSTEEAIESWYDQVDALVIVDMSKYDDWQGYKKYDKITKYVKSEYPIFDNPFGAGFTQALKLCDSDTVLFLDLDEVVEFPSNKNLKDIAKGYDLTQRALAFNMTHLYCSRYFSFKPGVVPTKGAHLFLNNPNYIHDLIPNQSTNNGFKRVNRGLNLNDGVRLINLQNQSTVEYHTPVPREDLHIFHTSHIDYFGKMVRGFSQFNHVATIDIKEHHPCDLRLTPAEAEAIYKAGAEEIAKKELDYFQTEAHPYDYKPNKLVDQYIERFGIVEFNPFEQAGYKRLYGESND